MNNGRITGTAQGSLLVGRWIEESGGTYDNNGGWHPYLIGGPFEYVMIDGGMTIFVARFVLLVRTFASFLAGVGSMDYRRFLIYNVVGGITCGGGGGAGGVDAGGGGGAAF